MYICTYTYTHIHTHYIHEEKFSGYTYVKNKVTQKNVTIAYINFDGYVKSKFKDFSP